MNQIVADRPATPDFAAIKTRQQATWASGDFAVIGTTLDIVGELLAEAVNGAPGSKCSTWLRATATPRWRPPIASPT